MLGHYEHEGHQAAALVCFLRKAFKYSLLGSSMVCRPKRTWGESSLVLNPELRDIDGVIKKAIAEMFIGEPTVEQRTHQAEVSEYMNSPGFRAKLARDVRQLFLAKDAQSGVDALDSNFPLPEKAYLSGGGMRAMYNINEDRGQDVIYLWVGDPRSTSLPSTAIWIGSYVF